MKEPDEATRAAMLAAIQLEEATERAGIAARQQIETQSELDAQAAERRRKRKGRGGGLSRPQHRPRRLRHHINGKH